MWLRIDEDLKCYLGSKNYKTCPFFGRGRVCSGEGKGYGMRTKIPLLVIQSKWP